MGMMIKPESGIWLLESGTMHNGYPWLGSFEVVGGQASTCIKSRQEPWKDCINLLKPWQETVSLFSIVEELRGRIYQHGKKVGLNPRCSLGVVTFTSAGKSQELIH